MDDVTVKSEDRGETWEKKFRKCWLPSRQCQEGWENFLHHFFKVNTNYSLTALICVVLLIFCLPAAFQEDEDIVTSDVWPAYFVLLFRKREKISRSWTDNLGRSVQVSWPSGWLSAVNDLTYAQSGPGAGGREGEGNESVIRFVLKLEASNHTQAAAPFFNFLLWTARLSDHCSAPTQQKKETSLWRA